MVAPKTHVTVHDRNGDAHTFGPGDELPAWAVKKIDNPNVLDRPRGTDTGPVSTSSPADSGRSRQQ